MKLFINVGGKGKRLYPLTKDIPKPMINILGKPVLHHIIEWAKKQDIEEIILLEGYKKEIIQKYFKDGKDFGIPIYHSVEEIPLQSGGAIKNAKKFIDGRFGYISGDHICDVNLNKMIDFHNKNNSNLTALVHESSHPEDSDILQIDNNYKVLKLISKKENHTNVGNLSNSGLCIIEPEIIDLMDKMKFDFEQYIYPKLIQKNLRFFAYKTSEFISDMGTFDRLKKCERYLKLKK